MLKLFVLLGVVACALGAALQPPLNGRIIGGNATEIFIFPWQVSVQRNGFPNCGGSIYSEDIIVTAAHCVEPISVDGLKIRAGSSFWRKGGVLMDVANFKYHEKYEPYTFINDIAVIRLKSPLKFSTFINPIELASVEPQSGAEAFVTGWGMTEYDANCVPDKLQAIVTTAINSETCREPFYGYGDAIHSSMICAASPGKDACLYDSGGPMVSDGVLVGVVSWGYRCAYENYPGVYANVAVLKNWIEEAAKTV